MNPVFDFFCYPVETTAKRSEGKLQDACGTRSMIPAFNDGGVLPPFIGGDATGELQLPRSPYPATMLSLVERFATSQERADILRGLMALRAGLRAAGLTDGLQWIDGSFVEDCESVKGRPPGDVDVVNLLRRPNGLSDDRDWWAFLNANLHLVDPAQTKAAFKCDAYFIDLDLTDRVSMVGQAAYWFGLFSHQRESFRWKGMVQLELMEDDAAAQAALDSKDGTW